MFNVIFGRVRLRVPWSDKGICRGRDRCAAAFRTHVDLRKKIWAKFDDVGGVVALFTLSKVTAHQTNKVMDALRGHEVAASRANCAADAAAKQER